MTDQRYIEIATKMAKARADDSADMSLKARFHRWIGMRGSRQIHVIDDMPRAEFHEYLVEWLKRKKVIKGKGDIG